MLALATYNELKTFNSTQRWQEKIKRKKLKFTP